MTQELLKRLAALRGINPRLNSVTDQVTEIVKSVEKTLVEELKIGIDASEWFLTDHGGEKGLVREHSLAFGRVGSAGYRIHLAIVTARDMTEQGGDPAPASRLSEERILWSSCSRELKLKAFEKLPELLDKIIKSAEGLLRTADETASRIKDLLGDSEPQPAPSAAPRQERRRRSRFSRAPRRVYNIEDAASAHRQYFLDHGITESALNSLTTDAWFESGPNEFVCCDKAGVERCCVIFVDEEGSAEVKFPDGEEDTVTIDQE